MEATLEEEAAGEETCPECRNGYLVKDEVRGEIVCGVCGLVVRENFIDKSPVWGRDDGTGPRLQRGSPSSVVVHDRGLTTDISPGLRDAQGTPLQGEERLRMRRLRTLQKRMRYSRAGEKSLAEALMKLDRMASVLGLPPEFKREAALLYRRAAAQGLVRGRTIRGMAAASLYVACRVLRAPRTLDEVADGLGVDRREVRLSYKALARGLQLGLSPPRAEEYLGRIASRLRLPMKVQARALALIRETEKVEEFSTKSPVGTVAACIYLASLEKGHRLSQERIGEAAGVSEVTVRVRYTSIADALGLELSPREGPAST